MSYFSELDVERQELGLSVEQFEARMRAAASAPVSVELDAREFAEVLDDLAKLGVEKAMDTLEFYGDSIADAAVELTARLHGPIRFRPQVRRDDEALTVSVGYPRVRYQTQAVLLKRLRMAARAALAVD